VDYTIGRTVGAFSGQFPAHHGNAATWKFVVSRNTRLVLHGSGGSCRGHGPGIQVSLYGDKYLTAAINVADTRSRKARTGSAVNPSAYRVVWIPEDYGEYIPRWMAVICCSQPDRGETGRCEGVSGCARKPGVHPKYPENRLDGWAYGYRINSNITRATGASNATLMLIIEFDRLEDNI
jgi:hypothetical protein